MTREQGDRHPRGPAQANRATNSATKR
jgi:hypothetical protein